MPLPIDGLDLSLIPYRATCEQTSGGIFTATTGSPPHRQFVIEWRTTYFQRTGNRELRGHPAGRLGDASVIYGQTVDNGSEETSGIQDSERAFTQFSCVTDPR